MTKTKLNFYFFVLGLLLISSANSWANTEQSCMLQLVASHAINQNSPTTWAQVGDRLDDLGTFNANHRREAETLRNIMSKRQHHAFMLGQGGEGKTTLAQAVLESLSHFPNYAVSYGVSESSSLRENIYALMCRVFEDSEQRPQLGLIFQNKESSLIELINQVMGELVSNDGDLYVFVDEFFDRGTSLDFIRLLSKHPRIHLVVSTTIVRDIDSIETQQARDQFLSTLKSLDFFPIRTRRLGLEDFRAGLTAIAGQFNLEITDDAIVALYEVSNGVEGRLQRILATFKFRTRTITVQLVRDFLKLQEQTLKGFPTASGDQFIDELFNKWWPSS